MFKFETNETIKQEINNMIIKNPHNKSKYRLSILYLIRIFILISCIFTLLVYSIITTDFYTFNLNLVIKIVLDVFLLIYIIFNVYTAFSTIIIIDNENITSGKIKVNIKEIKRIVLKDARIRGKRFEKVLSVVTKENKEYIFRLNISNKIRFIKQILELTNLKIEFSE